MEEIKHDSTGARELLLGNKCITVRLAAEFDQGERLSRGDGVVLKKSSGPQFAKAEIDKISKMSLGEFAKLRLDGHEAYRTIGDAVASMEEHYPEYSVWGSSVVYVIWYRNVEVENEI